MIKKITLASVLFTIALSGCATMQPEPSQKLAIPATVLTESPVHHVAVGLFAQRQKGVDVIVKTQTSRPLTISIVQPSSNPNEFASGEQVKVICSINSNQMRVIK